MDVIISPNRGTPLETPKYNINPVYRDPKWYLLFWETPTEVIVQVMVWGLRIKGFRVGGFGLRVVFEGV